MRSVLGLVLLIGLAFAPSAGSAEDKRYALVIGNQGYDSSVGALKNPHNDIAVVSAALARQGFEVLPPVKDARRSAILGAVRQLRDRLNAAGPGAVGFVYYSGHGAAESDTGINYIIPVDAKQPGSAEFWDDSLKLDDILKLLDGARGAAKFIVFDACRNELQVPTKSTTKGLAPIAEQQGMLIAYATSPGRTASDKGAGSGPFATALAAELDKPGLDHLNLFQNVKEGVLTATGGTQQPWVNDGLSRRIQMTALVPQKAPEPVKSDLAKPDKDLDIAFWNSVKDSKDADLLGTYLEKFPDGTFASLARIMTERAKADRAAQKVASDKELDLKRAEEAKRQAEVRQAEELRKAEVAKRQDELKAAQEQIAKAQAAVAAAEADKQAALKAAEDARLAAAAAKAEREAVTQSVGQETAKVASLDLKAVPATPEITPAMIRLVQSELSRLGCDPGSVDGKWGDKSRAALEQFAKRTKVTLASTEPDAAALDLLTRQRGGVCPLICGAGEVQQGDRCVAIKKEQPPAKSAGQAPKEDKAKAGTADTGNCFNRCMASGKYVSRVINSCVAECQ